MSTVTLTFTAADGSTKVATATVPPVTSSSFQPPAFDPSWIVSGGAVPAPPTKLWYVSPTGSPEPDGSRANPFSAQAVFVGILGQARALIGTMPSFYSNVVHGTVKCGDALSPIQPGHGIVLVADASGNSAFPALTVQAYFAALAPPGLDNGTNFITVMQEDGVTVAGIQVIGASGWFFNGLSFVGDLKDTPASSHGFQFSCSQQANNIIVANCRFSSRTPFAAQTPAQAIASAPQGILCGAGHVDQTNPAPGVYSWTTSSIQNITIANNVFFNVAFGIGAQRCDKVRICYNDISQHLFDGIDWGSNNMEIDHNYIHDRLNAGISYHPDFMQGQPWQVTTTTPWSVDSLSNINIHDNVGVGSTIPGLIWNSNISGCSQGMDYFNGKPQNLTFRNNLVIVTGNTQAMSLYGGDGLTVDHNTVLTSDLSTVMGCIITNVVGSNEVPVGTIQPPTNLAITNNLANGISVIVYCPSWSASNNVVIPPAIPGGRAVVDYAATPGGPKIYLTTVGKDNPVGTISGLPPSQVFAKWDWVNFLFDTTPRPGLPAYMTPGLGAPPWTNIGPRTANWPFK